MKVSEIDSKKIQDSYKKFRALGLPKEKAYRRTAQETGWGRTTILDHCADVEQVAELPQTKLKDLSYKGESKTYILTSWEIRVGIDDKFLDTLEVMRDYYNAELLLVPCQASDMNYLPDRVKEMFTVVTSNVTFNENLKLRYVETNALIQSPLSGHIGAYDSSTILPGLIKELRSEPTQKYIKQLMTTGSIGWLDAKISDYEDLDDDKDFIRKWKAVRTRRNGKANAIAENYITPSALIVDIVDNKTFLSRFITSFKDGIVYDLDIKFSSKGHEGSRPAALVVGDTHAYQANTEAVEATKEMIRHFSPREVILHDFFDGISVNHHEMHDAVKIHGVPSLREEADVTMNLLKEFCDISERVVYMHSNHDDFLLKVLQFGDKTWRINRNYEVLCGLQFFRLQTGAHPIVKLLDLNKISNLKFVKDTDNHYVGNVLCKHGHEGMSGARVGFLTLAKVYNFYVAGHTHSPAVFRNAVCVGVTGNLNMGYNKGASSWGHSNALIHPDSSMQLLGIINGLWR
jgi:hypothetical protein